MAPKDALPHHHQADHEAAGGRPIGVGYPTFTEIAERLLDNGYSPLPIRKGAKAPVTKRWNDLPIDDRQVAQWIVEHGDCGVGLRTGALVALDIDLLDADLSHEVFDLATRRFGESLLRIGLWPKRLLLYRTDVPRPKRSLGKVELLGLGQQVVAFGIHPDTARPYDWPLGDTPLDVPLDALPRITSDEADAFLAEVAAILPGAGVTRGRRRSGGGGCPLQGPTRDADGRVVDGRDGWLSAIAFHAVHDAIEGNETLDPAVLSTRVWGRFTQTTDLGRPAEAAGRAYDLGDAHQKVVDKLRLLHEGRLPARGADDAAPVDMAGAVPVAAARAALDGTLDAACARISGWWAEPADEPAPQIGIRATVGLGKSTSARRHLLTLRNRLRDVGAPDRIVVLTPSLRLADEAAQAWRAEGVRVAVHRGYEASTGAGEPMCRDIAAVRMAVAVGRDVRETACDDGKGNRCAFLATCAKQANRRAVAEADVVLAAYDAFYTGFALETSSIGLVVIDESPWPRAVEQSQGIALGRLATEGLAAMRGRGDRGADAMADLQMLRARLLAALTMNGVGPVARSALTDACLSADDCRTGALLEQRRLRDPGLRPGMANHERRTAAAVAAGNERARDMIALWNGFTDLCTSNVAVSPLVRIVGTTPETARVVASRLKRAHPNLSDLPVLHLDATMRPALTRRILPRLETTEIEAAAEHMTLRLITGGFGKSALIGDPRAKPEENQRRTRNLQACVDHVAWEARQVAPGRLLVVTYKDCEAAFRTIPGVETAHFNAIAGLDVWRDIALLVVVGRPLPSDRDVAWLCGALYGRWPACGFRAVRRGVRMRDGSIRGVSVIAHEDDAAETVRAAICDDEMIQAIGRGRGVNRGPDDPLEVQVLADVALPLIHDALAPWEMVRPDIMQRMLLAGIAVSSPTDATALHPALFENAEQAKKQFERSGFKGQIPISDTYRGLSLRSATYRLPGRGRSWAQAWWLDGDADGARDALTRSLGALAEWKPNDTS